MKISIIGLGFVGLTFAVVLASKGFNVIGIDADKKKLGKLKSKQSPFFEPKLSKTLSTTINKSLKVSSDIKSGVKNSDILFITVGTPLSSKGEIDLTNIKAVSKSLGLAIKNTKNKQIIVVKSTVIPGTTMDVIKPIIEKFSKKKEGKGFGLLTNPEFLREGKAIDDTLNPHIVVIGGNDKKAISKLEKFYKSLYKTKIPYIFTNPQTAELIKYANNSFLATKISFINQIASICESIKGANVDDVANAIGNDPRIGNLFLTAGPGYGGSCFPKDLQALISFSEKIGHSPSLLKGVQTTNNEQITKIVKRIKQIKTPKKIITILGLSFKENTDDIRESVSIKLIKNLLKNDYKIIVHDPKAMDNTKLVFGDKIRYANTIKDSLKSSECAVIMTAWNEYKKLKNNDLKLMKNKTVIDTRRILDKSKFKMNYYAVGHGLNI